MTNEEDQELELEDEVEEEVEVEEEEEIEDEVEEESVEDDTDWKAEALKFKAIALRNKKKSTVNSNITNKLETKASNPDVADRLSSLETEAQKRQFGYEHGLSPKETDAVFKIDSNPTADTLKDPFLKGGLKAIRSQERVDNNSPSTSAKSASLNRTSMKDMTPEEKQEKFTKYMKTKNG